MTSGNLDWAQQANSLDKSADLMGFLLLALIFLGAVLLLGLVEWLASRREPCRSVGRNKRSVSGNTLAATSQCAPGTADALSRPT